MAKSNTVAKNEGKRELVELFAMWKEQSKAGKSYFTGKFNGVSIRGFYNTKKKNPNEPDLRIYDVEGEGELAKEETLSLWCNATESGKKYLSGKYNGVRVVGFINEKATAENKQPYFTIYYSDDVVKEEPKKEEPQKGKKGKLTPMETDEDIPF